VRAAFISILVLAASPASAAGVESASLTHELKSAVVIQGSCGDKPPYAGKICPVEVLYFQSEPIMGPMKLRSFLRCTRQTFNGVAMEDCQYPSKSRTDG
jgi:hypothetical protein